MPDAKASSAQATPEEFEDGLACPAYARYCQSSNPPETSIDVLRVSKYAKNQKQWIPGLNHDSLRQLKFLDDPAGSSDDPHLLLLFLNMKNAGHVILAAPPSLEWLREKFGVPLMFFDRIFDNMSWGTKPGNACFDRYDDAGKVTRREAICHFSSQMRPCHVWTSHYQQSQSTIYIVSNCPTKAKSRILECAAKDTHKELLRPMMVDTFIADAASHVFKSEVEGARGRLMRQEQKGARQPIGESISETFRSLHSLSSTWHILYENLGDYEETLTFLLSVYEKNFGDKEDSKIINGIPNHRALESLLSRNHFWKRWVGNYNTRTQIRINLCFNLATQSDNRLNIEIAGNSKQIAEATLKDSSSMITIAAMTMLFLPGTFVSAIFSMTFFNSSVNSAGYSTLEVLPQWWYFPAATVPLTIVVFVGWRIWQQSRHAHLNVQKTRGDEKSSNRNDGHFWHKFSKRAESSNLDESPSNGDASMKIWMPRFRSFFSKSGEITASQSQAMEEAL